MSFTIKELIEDIIDSDLEIGVKSDILAKIYTTGRISEGLYLRRNEGTDDLECWYRNVDENGQTDHGPTNFTAEETVQACLLDIKPNFKPIKK